MIDLLFSFLIGASLADTTTPANQSAVSRAEAEVAAEAAMATATDVIAEGNRTVSLAPATFESCLNGIQSFVSASGQLSGSTITLRRHKVVWDGRQIRDLKTGSTLWSHFNDQMRLDGPERRPEAIEGKKAILVAEFEKPRRFPVDRTTDPATVRALRASLDACKTVRLQTFGMVPISQLAADRLKSIDRMFPGLVPRARTSPARRTSGSS